MKQKNVHDLYFSSESKVHVALNAFECFIVQTYMYAINLKVPYYIYTIPVTIVQSVFVSHMDSVRKQNIVNLNF